MMRLFCGAQNPKSKMTPTTTTFRIEQQQQQQQFAILTHSFSGFTCLSFIFRNPCMPTHLSKALEGCLRWRTVLCQTRQDWTPSFFTFQMQQMLFLGAFVIIVYEKSPNKQQMKIGEPGMVSPPVFACTNFDARCGILDATATAVLSRLSLFGNSFL